MMKNYKNAYVNNLIYQSKILVYAKYQEYSLEISA